MLGQALYRASFGKAGTVSIPAGAQTFTSNGTFTAPYDTVYTIVINAPIAKGGNGANGASGSYSNDWYSGSSYPASGGAGGSAYMPKSPLIVLVSLTQGQQVSVTVNSSISSFGSYGSFSAGTAGGNGTSGTSGSRPTNGSGGSGGSAPTYSVGTDVLYSISPSLPNYSLSGSVGYSTSGSGYDGEISVSYTGATGGLPSTAFGNSGGVGAGGAGVLEMQDGRAGYMAGDTISNGRYSSGLPAQTGSVSIIYGNTKS